MYPLMKNKANFHNHPNNINLDASIPHNDSRNLLAVTAS